MLGLFKTETDFGQLTEKRANLSIQLTNTPEDWDREILDHAYRLHSWLAEFALSVDFIKKLPDRRYGIGGIVVSPKKPLVPATKIKGAMGGPQQPQEVLAHLPIVIKEGTLSPIDLFVREGDVYPLEEDAFRKVVSGALDANSTSPSRSDPTLIGHLWPPGRSSFGGPGGEMGLNVLNKFSSDEEAHDEFYFLSELKKAAEDDIYHLTLNEGFPLIQGFLEGSHRADVGKVAKLAEVIGDSSSLRASLGGVMTKVQDNLPQQLPKSGSVVQMVRGSDGPMMRSTSPGAFGMSAYTPVTLDHAISHDPTVHCSCAQHAKIRTGKAQTVSFDYPALAVVKLKDGRETHRGTLFSTVYDLDGKATGQSPFTDVKKERWCLEDTVHADVGSELDSVTSASSIERGTGVFAFEGENGIGCTVPITIHSSDKAQEGTRYRCTIHCSNVVTPGMAYDSEIKLFIVDGIRMPTYSHKNGTLMVPSWYQWVPVGVERFHPYTPFQVENNPVKVTKLAGDAFMFEGQPTAGVVAGQVNYDDAMLTLGALGVAPEKIAGMLDMNYVELVDCNDLRAAEPLAAELPLQADMQLVKAAAVLGDPNTIDSVLGLNMADAENEDDFITIAQNLEETQQKVAKLLLLSRLGYYTIPEGAAKIVMARLTPVVDSLRILSLQKAYK